MRGRTKRGEGESVGAKPEPPHVITQAAGWLLIALLPLTLTMK